MNVTSLKVAVCVATIAAACILVPLRAQAQESWNTGRGSGASSWGGASGTAKMPEPQKPGSGSTRWMAGKQNFGSSRQAGGVWQDGSTPLARVSSSTATSLAAGMLTPHPTFGTMNLNLTSVLGGTEPAKAQISHSSAGQHTSGQHFGSASRGHSSPLRSSKTKSVAFQSPSSSIEGSRSNAGSSFGATSLNPPELPTQPSSSLMPELPDSGTSSSQQELLH